MCSQYWLHVGSYLECPHYAMCCCSPDMTAVAQAPRLLDLPLTLVPLDLAWHGRNGCATMVQRNNYGAAPCRTSNQAFCTNFLLIMTSADIVGSTVSVKLGGRFVDLRVDIEPRMPALGALTRSQPQLGNVRQHLTSTMQQKCPKHRVKQRTPISYARASTLIGSSKTGDLISRSGAVKT